MQVLKSPKCYHNHIKMITIARYVLVHDDMWLLDQYLSPLRTQLHHLTGHAYRSQNSEQKNHRQITRALQKRLTLLNILGSTLKTEGHYDGHFVITGGTGIIIKPEHLRNLHCNSYCTENQKSSWCQFCGHWQHLRFLLWQPPVKPKTTKFGIITTYSVQSEWWQ